MRRATGCRGFTLIELLVAISLMALMTVLSWRGLDGVSRAQTRLQQQSDDVLALQATLAQWGADLEAMAEQPDTPSLDWDGRALRIVRRSSAGPGEGLRVVAWARRSEAGQGLWLRWQSPPLLTRSELALAWQKAQVWAQTPSDDDLVREVRTVALDQWQIFYYRGNAWSNPLSSADSATAVGAASGASAAAEAPVPPPTATGVLAAVPDGVRLVLTLAPGQAIHGTLTRDWVRGAMGGGK
ncbi:prepilin-type N-terminal cleavage/methylation domain-containing protein [Rhodoferax sp.]|uniref:PulJ/GspJ family protein n=1 Tax=Rhodoferax sp. TaxID=50421 RepID=UPI0025DACCF4|nr:prepilin-type N-terminal cleavage/methylation domain-containing protein [Rhodoferax sp.]MCM2297462.1 prepilin-type N-terminal cleavage/methylation domain-containing protein [Rhodoferax sp.]